MSDMEMQFVHYMMAHAEGISHPKSGRLLDGVSFAFGCQIGIQLAMAYPEWARGQFLAMNIPIEEVIAGCQDVVKDLPIEMFA